MSISQENAAKMLKVEKERRAPIKASASRKGLGGEKGATSDNYQSTDFFFLKSVLFYEEPLKYRVLTALSR